MYERTRACATPACLVRYNRGMQSVFNPAERTRFAFLRQREFDNQPLTEDETAELHAFAQRIEDAERLALQTDKQRSEQRAAERDRHATALRELIARREALVAHLRQVAQEADEERAAIDAAFQNLVGIPRDHTATAVR